MAIFKLTIQPIDPLISRDSRPFGPGEGNKMRSLNWLMPSTACGALRSRVGKIHGSFDAEKLKSIKVRGPFLQCGESLYFPRPLDCVANEEKNYFVCPDPETWDKKGTEMPFGLMPALIRNQPEEDFKPKSLPEFWSASAMSRWLASPENFSLSKDEEKREGLSGPTQDERVHVKIDPKTGASEDSLLFSTTGLDFRISVGEENNSKKILQLKVALEAEVQDSEYEKYFAALSSLHPLGGERRLADWKVENHDNNIEGWRITQAPEEFSSRRLRMILATPAIFSKGWLPGWVEDKGLLPGTDVRISLVSAVIGRWEPISGWSYEKGKRGIKPLRRMVPAGSVYFFETIGTVPADFDWQKLWLRSVCDEERDCNDGFGAALWGTW